MKHRCARRAAWPIALRAVFAALVLVLGTAELVDGQVLSQRCGRAAPPTLETHAEWFPAGTLFCPMLADRRETVSYLGAVDFNSPWVGTTVAMTSIGDHIPLFRAPLGAPDSAVQLSLAAAVIALFDLNVSTFDFLHADFIVGVPLAVRRGAWSFRLRPYHWSSHIGDEFLLREPQSVARKEISLEAIELLVARTIGPLRVVGGGEWWAQRVPSELPGGVGVLGVELKSPGKLQLGDYMVVRGRAGGHVRWSSVEPGPSASLRAGFEFGRGSPGWGPERRVGVMVEWFDGNSPFGQFFEEHLRFFGLSLYFN